jgi:hypothetical protein
MAMALADPVVDYVSQAQPIHLALQRVLVQLSAFLLTQLGARHRALCDRAPVEAARQALTECIAPLAALRVPAGAAHHRRHLDGAAEALEQAVLAALARDSDGDDRTFRALEEAERHLRTLARILPGFEPVDFTQACCAAHGGLAAAAMGTRTRRVGEDDGRLFDLGAGLRCG